MVKDIEQHIEVIEQSLSSAAPGDRKKIEDLLQQLHEKTRVGEQPDVYRDLIADLEAQVVEFEVRHPDLTGALKGLLNYLSSLGI
jgi:hypothetical protein